MDGREVQYLSGFFGIIAIVLFASGRRNTTGSPFRWGRGLIAIGFLLLALAVLTAACGTSSDEDATPDTGAGTAVPSSGSAVPPAPTGASKEVSREVAKQELDILIQLSQGELTLDRRELATYSEQVGTVLNRIDSNPDVLESFKNLLEEMLGVTFLLEDAAGLNDERPGKVGQALPMFAPIGGSFGPFKCSAANPDYDPYAGSMAWLYLRCFMDALFDVNVPASEALTAADPIFATEITKFAVRTQITDRCITDIERCVRGDDPVLNKFQQGDIAGAHKTIRELAPKPRKTSGPTETPTRVPKAILPPTATMAPTEVLPPTATPVSTAIPTAIPTPASGASDFSGTWVGRYIGLYHHGFPICGSTIPIEGSVTAVLTQTGTQVTGTATLGGSDVLEIVEAGGVCRIVNAADEVTMIAASVSGDTLSSAPGLPVTFSMTKSSENSAEGTIKDPYLDATFFLGRLR